MLPVPGAHTPSEIVFRTSPCFQINCLYELSLNVHFEVFFLNRLQNIFKHLKTYVLFSFLFPKGPR